MPYLFVGLGAGVDLTIRVTMPLVPAWVRGEQFSSDLEATSDLAGGFGGRGVEGKILAAHYARTEKKPYLGICLGMQARRQYSVLPKLK